MSGRGEKPDPTARHAACAAVLALCVIASASGHAHAFLDHASPPVGAELQQAPDRVSLWFSQRLEPAFSTVEIVDRSGNRVDRGDGQVDSADARWLHASLKHLSPGIYKVIWRAVSVDTHVTDGDYTFRIEGQ